MHAQRPQLLRQSCHSSLFRKFVSDIRPFSARCGRKQLQVEVASAAHTGSVEVGFDPMNWMMWHEQEDCVC